MTAVAVHCGVFIHCAITYNTLYILSLGCFWTFSALQVGSCITTISCFIITLYTITDDSSLTGSMLHTDSFNDKSLWWPQSSAHPRFSHHLQVVCVPLNEKHPIFHPSLEVHFSYGLNEPLIPETAQVLRLKVRKNLLATRGVGVEFPSAGAQTLLVRAEDYSERSGGELDNPLLVRHFQRLYWLQEGAIMLGMKMHLLKDGSPLWKSKQTPCFATHSSGVRLGPAASEPEAQGTSDWFLSASRETSDGGREEEGSSACCCCGVTQVDLPLTVHRCVCVCCFSSAGTGANSVMAYTHILILSALFCFYVLFVRFNILFDSLKLFASSFRHKNLSHISSN